MKLTLFLTYIAGIISGLWVAAQSRVLNFPVIHLPKRIQLDLSSLMNVDALFICGFFVMLWVVSRSRRQTRIISKRGSV
jgi:hypothetical protein